MSENDTKKPEEAKKEPATEKKAAASAAPAGAKATSKPPTGSRSASADEVIMLGKSIEIFPGQPLPKLNQQDLKAYSGRNKESGDPLVALLCEKHLTPRRKDIQTYKGIINSSLVDYEGHGVVRWTPENKRKQVIVYKNNLGNPLKPDGGPEAMGWKVDLISGKFIKDLIHAVLDLHAKDFVHGQIRASNMFDGGSPPGEKIILGDCLTTPASSGQPVLYETITRSMAHPLSRGKGTTADDLYSLGVSIFVIIRGTDPFEGKSAKELIKNKIEFGSYSTLVGKERFSGPILELLRGLLNDSVEQRWGQEELYEWMEGRRPTSKQAPRAKKASRGLQIGEQKYMQTNVLALELEDHAEEAIAAIKDESMTLWLDRAFDDEALVARYQKAQELAVQNGSEKSKGYQDKLIALLSMAFDQSAPLRFKGYAFSNEGIGFCLTSAMAQKQDIGIFDEVFISGLLLNWANMQDENSSVDRTAVISRYDSCRNFARQKKMSFGMERCLYFLNQEAPCLSENLDAYYVKTPQDLLFAFEDMCEKGDAPHNFIDLHVAGFLGVHDRPCVDTYLFELSSSLDHQKMLGNLKCLATIQKRNNLSGFPALAQNIEDKLQSVYERFHDGQIQDKLKKNMVKIAKSGDLVKMASILDNTEVREKDRNTFYKALGEYAKLIKEYDELNAGMKKTKTFGVAAGRDVSAFVCCAMALIVILLVAFSGITKPGESFF